MGKTSQKIAKTCNLRCPNLLRLTIFLHPYALRLFTASRRHFLFFDGAERMCLPKGNLWLNEEGEDTRSFLLYCACSSSSRRRNSMFCCASVWPYVSSPLMSAASLGLRSNWKQNDEFGQQRRGQINVRKCEH